MINILFRNNKILIGFALIAATLSSGFALANSQEKENNANNINIQKEYEEKENEENNNEVKNDKQKLNAEDVYLKVENDKKSDLAKFTSTPEWLLIRLIESGEFGETSEEIKENLIKEGFVLKNINIDEIISKKTEETNEAEETEQVENVEKINQISQISSTNSDKEQVNYNNFITKDYGLGNLDTFRGDSFTITENAVRENQEQKAESKDNTEQTVETASSSKSEVIPAYPHEEFKSYMRWTALHPQSKQGKFSAKASPDPETAIMMYNGRYLVALGFAYADYVGQEIDIVMESGQVIPAVIGDFKAKEHTDERNATHLWDGSALEFVVSSNEEAAKVTNYTGSYNNIFPGLIKEFRK